MQEKGLSNIKTFSIVHYTCVEVLFASNFKGLFSFFQPYLC